MNAIAKFVTAADVFTGWREQVLTGGPPTLYPIATAGELARIEIGPGLVTLIGGAPGSGKTCFAMQAVIDALRISPSLRAIVCNVEMSPAILLERQLSRLSGIDLTTIRYRRFDQELSDRLDSAMNTLDALADRLAFVQAPFNLNNVTKSADEFGADLLLLDYVQRILPPGEHGDRRIAVNATMDHLREAADAGYAVIVVSAVGRVKDSKGRSSYAGEGLNLASFRESSELEFGADDAFMLVPDGKNANLVTLKHLKSRNTEPRDIVLAFDRYCQRFRELEYRNEQNVVAKRLNELAAPSLNKQKQDDPPKRPDEQKQAFMTNWLDDLRSLWYQTETGSHYGTTEPSHN